MRENDKFLKALGKNIDRIRKEKGLSFQEMAYCCDIEKANIVKLTSRGENITVNTLYKIAKGLGVSLKVIFDFDLSLK
jgi:transcriptional regulator with XRE-family HTH domain